MSFMGSDFLKEMHSQLRGNYPAGWDADRDAAVSRVLRSLLEEIGPRRLEKAVCDCCKNEQFYSEFVLRRWIPMAIKYWQPDHPEPTPEERENAKQFIHDLNQIARKP